MLVVAEMVGEFGLQRAFDDRFGELLQQTVGAEHLLRRLAVFQPLVEDFG